KDIALKTIEAMKQAGADAVKIQTYTADTMTLDSEKESFVIKQGSIWDGRKFHDLYKEAYTPWEWHAELKEHSEALGMAFFSSPFDATAVDFLDQLGVPAYKVASFEITDLPLIEYLAKKGKPVILSTGIATLADIEAAVSTCRNAGNEHVTLLKCTSAYPAPLEGMNLKMIPVLAQTFGVPVGLSDHTPGSVAAVAAVALGACLIEKHFILDRKLGGPDASFSMEPAEFAKMVKQVRDTEKTLGNVTWELTPAVKKSREFSRSLYASKPIPKGASLTKENVRCVRPAFGLAPKHFTEIIGRKAAADIAPGTPLRWGLLED
ncbi:MAG: pseudaminic acid synthase, partial [Spirochaetia bacterium]|nr:pseudaminic acid synthase [Spirochaetia bacterium]